MTPSRPHRSAAHNATYSAAAERHIKAYHRQLASASSALVKRNNYREQNEIMFAEIWNGVYNDATRAANEEMSASLYFTDLARKTGEQV